jgi:homospermidine synthase
MNALIIGFGSIARALCTLKVPFNNLVIIDKLDFGELIQNFFKDKDAINPNSIKQIKFINIKITKENLISLREIIQLNKINIIIDCAYNIDTFDLLTTLPSNVAYINTSVEDWEEDNVAIIKTLKERQDKIKHWYNTKNPSNNILLDCGMNPGLISLWAYECCDKMKLAKNDITQCIISEIDTQRAKIPRTEGEFVSTWSPDGFMEEIHSPLEGHSNGNYYVNNKSTGYKTVSVSMRPSGEIFYGFTVRHAETITLHKLFPNATLMYIYRCPNEAVGSLFEYQDPKPLKSKRILFSNDIIDGRDELGVLISDGKKLFWYGSLLSNNDVITYPLGKYINSTSYQVACGLWIGINTLQYYMNTNTSHLMTPEDIINCPLFEDLLYTVNKYLQIKLVEFENNEVVNRIINNKSFDQHSHEYFINNID